MDDKCIVSIFQADITVLSPSDNPNVSDLGPNIIVEDKKIVMDQSSVLVVASELFSSARAEVF